MLQDLRFAFRSFSRNPGFMLVVVLALALGIGANTAIFSIVNAVLLRPLPYNEPDRLVMLWGNVQRTVVERRGNSFPDFFDWRERSQSFEGMTAAFNSNPTLYSAGEPERIAAEVVSASYFRLLGIQARHGRVFRPEDDAKPDAPPVAVIGEALWQRRFGGDPGLIGRQVQLDNRSYTIAGIIPAGFRGLSSGEAELWLPVMAAGLGDTLGQRGSRWFPVLARLKPGVSIEQAQAEMTAISAQLEKAYPETNEKRSVEVTPLSTEIFGAIRPALLVLLAAVAFVLLIACANVINLLLARAESRQNEIAIRTALGAGRGRILRQLTVEGLLLTGIGGALALLVAQWGADALLALSPVQFPNFVNVRLDGVVIGFTLLISLTVGVLVGLAPAFSSGFGAMNESLKEASGRSSGGVRRQRFRNALAISEIALAIVLLVGAGLFMRSFRELAILDPGFRPEGLLTMRVSLPPPAQPSTPSALQQTASAARILQESLRALPGVRDVGLSSDLPLSNEGGAIFYTAEGQPPVTAQNMPRTYVHRVTPGYFRTLGVEMLRGRDFAPEEADGSRNVVVVTEGLVRRFWSGQDPIGKRIKGGRPDASAPWLQIIGVVADLKYRGLPRNPTPDPDIFLPFNERARGFALLVRTQGEPGGFVGAVRDQIRSVDASSVVFNVAPMTERVARQMARSRFTTWLMGAFAGTALLLALIGIYGVMAYSVAQRTREIGIRMALGAARTDVLRMVVLRALVLVGAGVAIGLAASFGLTRLVETMLYGVSATDPLVFGGVAALLIAVAMLAAYIPARRATRVDPMIALRYE